MFSIQCVFNSQDIKLCTQGDPSFERIYMENKTICLPTCLPICLSICLPNHLSFFFLSLSHYGRFLFNSLYFKYFIFLNMSNSLLHILKNNNIKQIILESLYRKRLDQLNHRFYFHCGTVNLKVSNYISTTRKQ